MLLTETAICLLLEFPKRRKQLWLSPFPCILFLVCFCWWWGWGVPLVWVVVQRRYCSSLFPLSSAGALFWLLAITVLPRASKWFGAVIQKRHLSQRASPPSGKSLRHKILCVCARVCISGIGENKKLSNLDENFPCN